MAKNTLIDKLKSENRKLNQANDKLVLENRDLKKKLDDLSNSKNIQCRKNIFNNYAFNLVYDIIISALVLVFVYWIAITGYEEFDTPFIYCVMLFILVLFKCLAKSKECLLRILIGTIFNDLVKPTISMFIGLFLCIIYLGDKWKMARPFALDVGYTVILVLFVGIAVILGCVAYSILIAIKKCIKKTRKKKE